MLFVVLARNFAGSWISRDDTLTGGPSTMPKNTRRKHAPHPLTTPRSVPAQAVVTGETVAGTSSLDVSDRESVAESIASIVTAGPSSRGNDDRVHQLSDQIESMKRRCDTQESVLASVHEKLAARDKELASVSHESRTREEHIATLKRELAAAQEHSAEAAQAAEAARTELEQAKKQQPETPKHPDTPSADGAAVAELQATISALQNDLADAQNAFSESQRDFAEQMAAIATQHQRDVEEATRSAQQQLQEMHASLDREKEAHRSTAAEKTHLVEQVKDLATQASRAVELQEELTAMRKAVDALTEQTTMIGRERTTLEEELAHARSIAERSRNSRPVPFDEVLARLDFDGEDYTAMERLHAAHNARCASLQHELGDFSARLEDVSAAAARAQAALDDLQQHAPNLPLDALSDALRALCASGMHTSST